MTFARLLQGVEEYEESKEEREREREEVNGREEKRRGEERRGEVHRGMRDMDGRMDGGKGRFLVRLEYCRAEEEGRKGREN